MTQQNYEMGRCRVSLDERDLGETSGSVGVSFRTLWRERRSERFGQSVVDRVCVGHEARVKMRLTEKSLENLRSALPSCAQGATELGLGAPGLRASTMAGTLRLHPEERADSGRDIVMRRAVAEGALELEFGPGGARTFEVEFVGLMDAGAGEMARVRTED